MGRNFVSVCYYCDEKALHLRGEEGKGMHEFYKQHDKCMRIAPRNVGTWDDQVQEVYIPETFSNHNATGGDNPPMSHLTNKEN